MSVVALKEACRAFLDECRCPLCTEFWRKASSFPCGHTFCYDCAIATLEGPGISQSECPTCKQKYWKRDLKPNPQLMAAVEHAQKILSIAGYGSKGLAAPADSVVAACGDDGTDSSYSGQGNGVGASGASHRQGSDPGPDPVETGLREDEVAGVGCQGQEEEGAGTEEHVIASLGAALRRSNPGCGALTAAPITHAGQNEHPQAQELLLQQQPQQGKYQGDARGPHSPARASSPMQPLQTDCGDADGRRQAGWLQPASRPRELGHGAPGRPTEVAAPEQRTTPAGGCAHNPGASGGCAGMPGSALQLAGVAAAGRTAFTLQPADLVFSFHTGCGPGRDPAAAAACGAPAAQPHGRERQRRRQVDPEAAHHTSTDGDAAAAAAPGSWGTPCGRAARRRAASGGQALVAAGTMTTPHTNLLPQPRSQPVAGWPTPSHGRPAADTDTAQQRPGSVVSIRRGTPSVNNAYLQFHSLLEEAVNLMAQDACVRGAAPEPGAADRVAAGRGGGGVEGWDAFDEAAWHRRLAALPGPTAPEREALEFELSIVNLFLGELQEQLATAAAAEGSDLEAGEGARGEEHAAAEAGWAAAQVEEAAAESEPADRLAGLSTGPGLPPRDGAARVELHPDAAGALQPVPGPQRHGSALRVTMPPAGVGPDARTSVPAMGRPDAACATPLATAAGAPAAAPRTQGCDGTGVAVLPGAAGVADAAQQGKAPAEARIGGVRAPADGTAAAAQPPSPSARRDEEEAEVKGRARHKHKRARIETVCFNAGKERSRSPEPQRVPPPVLPPPPQQQQQQQAARDGAAAPVPKDDTSEQLRRLEGRTSAPPSPSAARPRSPQPPPGARDSNRLEPNEADDGPAPMPARRRAPNKRYRSEPPRPPPARPAQGAKPDHEKPEPHAVPLPPGANRAARRGRARGRDSGAAAAAVVSVATDATAAGNAVCRNKVASILATGLSGSDKGKLKELYRRVQRIELLGDVLPQMTHLVVKLTPGGRAVVRTVKYLRAVVQGCWVVGVEWAEACLAAGRLVPEGPYEATGDPVHEGAPALCRLRVERGEPPLFSGVAFCVNYLTAAGKVPRSDVEALLQAAGGRIVRRPPTRPGAGSGGATLAAALFGSAAGDVYDSGQPSQAPTQTSLSDRDPAAPPLPPGFPPVIVLLATMDSPDASRVVREWGCAPVLRDWVFDSISHFQVLPVELYTVAPDSQRNMTESTM